MAKSKFSSRYRKYKRNTENFVRWLCATARRLVPIPGTSLSVQDLLNLTHAICNAVPHVNIPIEIVYAVQDAIAGRVEASRFYATLLQSCQVSSLLAEQNAQHEHFILVLKEILKLLKTTRSCFEEETKSRKDEGRGNHIDPTATAEILRLLDAETGRAEGCDNIQPAYYSEEDVNLGDDAGDLLFELWTLLQDQRDLRQHVQELWNRYHKGQITFAVAARTTDAAFGLIRELCDDFSLRSYEQLTLFLGLALFSSSNGPMFFTLATNAADHYTKDEITNLLCLPAAAILYGFKAGRASFSQHPFGLALDAVSEYVATLAARGGSGDQAIEGVLLDEFTRRLIVIKQEKTIPMSAAFQAQIYMDVFEAIGGNADQGLAFAKGQARMLRAHCREHFAERTELTGEQTLRALSAGLTDYAKTEPGSLTHQLLNNLPLLAPRRAHEVLDRSRWMLLDEACDRLSLIGAAFLYQAAPCTGPTDYVWGDMDFVLEEQDLKRSLMHDATSLKHFANHYSDAFCGTSTAADRALTKLKPTSSVVLTLTTAAAGRDPTESVESQLRRVASHLLQNSRPAVDASPMDLLSSFEQALRDAEQGYNFDYVAFGDRCRELLWKVAEDNSSTILRLLGGEQPTKTSLSHVILQEAANAKPIDLRRTVLSKLGRSLDQMRNKTGKFGNELEDAAWKKSSGGLLETKKPYKRHPRNLPETMSEDDQAHAVFSEVMMAVAKLTKQWADEGMDVAEIIEKKVQWVTEELKRRGVPFKLEVSGENDDEHRFVPVSKP